MICKDGVIAFATPEQLANLNEENVEFFTAPYSPEELEAVRNWRLEGERVRNREHRKSEKGGFEAAMQSFDELYDSFHDPSEIAMFSDRGDGERRVVYDCDLEEVDGRRFVTIYDKLAFRARIELAKVYPETVEVFDLILKNGKNRKESVGVIAASHNLSRDAAGWRYRDHREKILNFFGVPINHGETDDETANS